MTSKINSKTPGEIKRGLSCCRPFGEEYCAKCPYDGMVGCVKARIKDTNVLIKRLERERDAAIADMTELMRGSEHCMFCKYLAEDGECTNPNLGAKTMCWEWRGVQEVK